MSSASAGGKEADPTFGNLVWWAGRIPHAAGRNNGFLSCRLGPAAQLFFVTASQQTGLDTRSMTRRSIKMGVEGGGVDYAGHHRLSASNLSLTLNTAPSRSRASVLYFSTVSPTRRVWHKTFLWWFRVQGCSPDAPVVSKMPRAPSAFP